MTDYDIHSCGYYCNRPACIEAQRNELRDRLLAGQTVKTYSGGKPNYTQPIVRITTPEDIAKIKSKWEPILPGGGIGRHPDPEPTIDDWPLYSGLPPVKVQDEREENYKSFAQSAQVLGAQYDPRREPVIDKSMAKRIATQLGWKPKREWQGLTNDEIEDIRLEYHYADGAVKVGYERAIEAKLKEKNA